MVILDTMAELEAEKSAALKNSEMLSQQVSALNEEKQAIQAQLIQAQRQLEECEREKQALEQTCNALSSLEVENADLLLRSEAAENRLAAAQQATPGSFDDGTGSFADEILSLKESVLRLEDEKTRLRETLETRDRKIALLEDELRSPVPGEANRERKIAELENRNAELKQQMWGREAELSDLRNDLANQIESYEEKLATYKSLLANTEEQLDEEKFLVGSLKEQVAAQQQEATTRTNIIADTTPALELDPDLDTEDKKSQEESLLAAQVGELTARVDSLTSEIVTRDEEWRSAYAALDAVRAQLLEELATADAARAQLVDQLSAAQVQNASASVERSDDDNDQTAVLQREVTRLGEELATEQEAHKKHKLEMKAAMSEMHFKMSELLDLRISLEQELQEATLNRSIISTPVPGEGAAQDNEKQSEELASIREQLEEESRLRRNLENEVIYLQSIIEDQKAEETSYVEELRAKLVAAEKELAAAAVQSRNDASESDLAMQFAEAEKMKLFLTEEVRALQEKLTLTRELEEKLLESESKHTEVLAANRSEMETLISQLSVSEQECVELQEQNTQLHSDAVELKAMLTAAVQSRNDASESDLATQFAEAEKMKHYLTEEVRALQEKLTQIQTSAEVATRELEEKLVESETKYADIISVSEAYRIEIETLTKEVSVNEQERVELQEEVTRLNGELTAARALASIDSVDNTELSALRASLEQATSELAALTATIAARDVELVSAREHLQNLETDCSDLRDQVEALKVRLAEETATSERSAENFQKELADSVASQHKLENDIIYLESELSDLRAVNSSSSSEAEKARGDLVARLARLEDDKAALNLQVLQLSGESQQTSREELVLREKLAQHTEAYAALEATQVQVSKELSVVRLEYEELKQQLASRSDESQRLQKQLDAAEEASAQLRKELMQAQHVSDTFSAELEHYKALQENHSTSVSALQTQASELQRLNAEVDALGVDVHAARAEVARLQDVCTRQEGEAAGLRLALRNSEEDLQSLLEENNQLSNQSSSESRKLQELRDELSRLNTELQLAKSAHHETTTTSQRPQQVYIL